MPDDPAIEGNDALRNLRFVAALGLTGVICGSLSALFLVSLDCVTEWHGRNPWLLLLLPFAGMGMVWFYDRYGALAARGNVLLVEEIRQNEGNVPLRMAPMVLVSTLLTHLCGGSAGREGTAVQMGGAISAWLSRLFSLTPTQRRMLLMAGIAGGFGSVFGTPWAGGIFAAELPVRGRWQTRMLLPCWLSAWIGHVTCRGWGVVHIDYRTLGLTREGFWGMTWSTVGIVILAAFAFGICSRVFVWISHKAPDLIASLSPSTWARPCVGGFFLIAMVYVLGTADYLGLGVSAQRAGGIDLLSCFSVGGADTWSWFWKMLFTVITLSSGFKGGEVTPLFFIGAALGNALAMLSGQPVELWAGLGMLAVFAGAANAPLTCTILGMELFGPHYTILFAIACLCAFFVSGRSGIYEKK